MYRHRHIFRTTALSLAFVLTQVYLGLAFGASNGIPNRTAAVPPPQATAILTTDGNKPITVNGASVTSGATIVSGAVIETPAGVTAKVTIPGRGTIVIDANTKLTLEFDKGNVVKVTLRQGCAVLHTRKGTASEVDDGKGGVSKTDGTKEEIINGCPGKVITVKSGARGLSTAALVAIFGGGIGGGVTALAFALRGSNPSRSSP